MDLEHGPYDQVSINNKSKAEGMPTYGRFRGNEGVDGATAGLIGGQILLGISGGLLAYTTQVGPWIASHHKKRLLMLFQAAVQAATRHEHVAVIVRPPVPSIRCADPTL